MTPKQIRLLHWKQNPLIIQSGYRILKILDDDFYSFIERHLYYIMHSRDLTKYHLLTIPQVVKKGWNPLPAWNPMNRRTQSLHPSKPTSLPLGILTDRFEQRRSHCFKRNRLNRILGHPFIL